MAPTHVAGVDMTHDEKNKIATHDVVNDMLIDPVSSLVVHSSGNGQPGGIGMFAIQLTHIIGVNPQTPGSGHNAVFLPSTHV